MAALSPPYAYATLDDVKAHGVLSPAEVDVVVATLPHGETTARQLLADYSREADTYLGKRRSVPIKVTPHASLKMYVAKQVSFVLQLKRGELPEANDSKAREQSRDDLLAWIRSVVDPSGFVEVPEENENDGSAKPKAQTLCYSRQSPYPDEWGNRRG